MAREREDHTHIEQGGRDEREGGRGFQSGEEEEEEMSMPTTTVASVVKLVERYIHHT